MRNNIKNIRELAYNSPAIERLKTLSIIHSRLTNEHARYLNKLHFTVRQYFPLHDALFSHFGCTAQLALIRKYPAYDCLRSVPDDDIKGLLKTHHYRRTKHLDKLIAKIRNYYQMISPDVEFAYRFEAECLCKIILVISEELNRIKREMKMIIDSHPLGDTFKSLPGAGNILACKLLALFGDNKDRFGNSNGAQCLFGTAPKNYQSGMYHKIIMRKACNKSGRDILYKFAFSSLQFSKWAREYYDKQRLKGKTHSVSIRALSNKWVKVIYKVWKDEMLYDDNIKISSAA